MTFLYDGLSLKNGRSSNMDSLLISEREISGRSSLLAVVCDGVGSMEDGGFAASCAVKLMNQWFFSLTDARRIGLKMRDEVLDINTTIIRQSKELSLKTASTLTALLFYGDKYYGVHIGDTRAYSFSADGTPTLLTVDHVSESGKLTGCIGKFENPVLFCTEGSLKAGMFMICSDGLYKRTDIKGLGLKINARNAKDIKKMAAHLAESAIKGGEKDNISVVLVIPKLEGEK